MQTYCLSGKIRFINAKSKPKEHQTICFHPFSCAKTQTTISDQIMKNLNSLDSLQKAMDSIVWINTDRQMTNTESFDDDSLVAIG